MCDSLPVIENKNLVNHFFLPFGNLLLWLRWLTLTWLLLPHLNPSWRLEKSDALGWIWALWVTDNLTSIWLVSPHSSSLPPCSVRSQVSLTLSCPSLLTSSPRGVIPGSWVYSGASASFGFVISHWYLEREEKKQLLELSPFCLPQGRRDRKNWVLETYVLIQLSQELNGVQ